MADLERIVADLDEEMRSLDEQVAGLSTQDAPTPTDPWSVRDQISHPSGSGRRPGQLVEDRG